MKESILALRHKLIHYCDLNYNNKNSTPLFNGILIGKWQIIALPVVCLLIYKPHIDLQFYCAFCMSVTQWEWGTIEIHWRRKLKDLWKMINTWENKQEKEMGDYVRWFHLPTSTWNSSCLKVLLQQAKSLLQGVRRTGMGCGLIFKVGEYIHRNCPVLVQSTTTQKADTRFFEKWQLLSRIEKEWWRR